MTKETNAIALTTDQIKSLGSKINSLLSRLELIEQSCNASLLVANSDIHVTLSHSQMKKTVNAIHDQVSQIYEELDDTACLLLLCDDEEELKAYGVTIAGESK